MTTRIAGLYLIFMVLALVCALPARATISLLEKDAWKVSMGGFVETDAFVDSTRAFTEVVGNNAVSRPDALAGQAGRTQFSIRNSRLAFTVEAPEVDHWATKGYLEFDLLGFDPAPGTAGNTEAGLFNNPTFRARHAYLAGENSGWQLMAGQYWMLLGWQPYYFMPTVQVAPLPAMLYGRTAQARATKSMDMGDDLALQAAVGVMRPPQRDAMFPGLEAGARLAWSGRSAGFVGGSTGAQKTQPASLALSGAFRQIEIPANTATPNGDLVHYGGYALVADALMPVLASSDGKDPSGTLMIGGEFTTGKGYGDQFPGWSGGLASPLNSVATAPEKNVNLDAGIGGFDSFGDFMLVELRTFNAYLQYHLPAWTRAWVSGGYGRLYSDNINLMTSTGANVNKTSAGNIPYMREEAYFANAFRDFTKAIRLGFEFAQIRTLYGDGVIAHDNRYQLSAFFIF